MWDTPEACRMFLEWAVSANSKSLGGMRTKAGMASEGFTQRGLELLGVFYKLWLFKGGTLGLRGVNVGEKGGKYQACCPNFRP